MTLSALHAEWTKVRTVAGPGLLLLGAVVLTVAVSGAAMTYAATGPGKDLAELSLTGIQFGQAVVAVLAVTAVGNEYTTGMIHTTLTALPHRNAVLAAKASIITGAVVVAGAIAVSGCLLAGRLILPRNGYPPLSLTDGPTMRAAAGSVLYLALIALLSLGVATAVRDSATAIGVVLGLMYLFPILAGVVSDPHWRHRLDQVGPTSAGLAIQATTSVRALPISPWAGLGVLAAWATAALLTGGLVLRLRDA